MKDEVLLDTNVLVYAYDMSGPAKQKRAVDLLRDLSEREEGIVTTQVMAEMFFVLTRRLGRPLTAEQAVATLARHMRTWHVLEVTDFVVLEAARGVRDHKMSYWDAQIWASAKLNQIPIILSEDFASGSILEGVRFVDPFV